MLRVKGPLRRCAPLTRPARPRCLQLPERWLTARAVRFLVGSRLLQAERLNWIDPGSTTAGQRAREQGDRGESHRHENECRGIRRPDTKQQTAHDGADGQRAGQPQRGTDGGQQQAAAEDQAEASRGLAPSASRTPISWLRWATT